jgi:biopolymer transport protein ExbD
MFTVLTIFLLQNYRTTGEVMYLPKEVHLPDAKAVKELAPAHVVTISKNSILIDKTVLVDANLVREQEAWMVDPLYNALAQSFQKEDALENQRQQSVGGIIRSANNPELKPTKGKRVTVQADKEVDFLTVKKIMFTLTEAGASEINFAVIKDETETVE